MTPAVSMATGVLVYAHSSPSGSFECTVSGLRWVCVRDVTLQYHFNNPDIFREELAMLQYSPIGPLMNIKVLSGELLEAHFLHFACLDGSDSALNEAVRVLHSVDGGVHLETCELTRFHAKLMNPSFSLIGALLKIGIPMKTHLEVLTYRTRVTPLVLFTYVVPRDASMIQAVEEEIKKYFPHAREVINPPPYISVWFYTKCSLKASTGDARITPAALPLEYTTRPYFFKVVIDIDKVKSSFDLELVSAGQSIWKATLDRYEMEEEPENTTMCAAASGHSRDGEEVKNTNSATGKNEQERKMGTQSSKGVGVSATAGSGGVANAPVLSDVTIGGSVNIFYGSSSQENTKNCEKLSD
ncbi:NACHT, LRR and PYD domains-containing protein 1 homolog [Engraulis encrasicolus]|uniref:NACHT, LRR and PYD domains-containing protein 1 homolog n=1 Tax=Engraulis encrasicolus TaxID=184585 RepID=UPI002FD71AAF